MANTIHVALDIQGFLMNSTGPSDFKHFLENGQPMNPRDAKRMLLKHLADGHKFLPTTECEGFSYETGCPGHKEAETP